MEPNDAQSALGLNIQWVGILLIVVLTYFIRRSIRRTFLTYWALAWVSLCAALLAFIIGLRAGSVERLIFPLYIFGEYCFGIFFIAGCRAVFGGTLLGRKALLAFAGAAVLATLLPWLIRDFNVIFVPHAAVMAGMFGVALFSVTERGSTPGRRVMSVALVLLTLDFLHYAPVFAYVTATKTRPPLDYLRYSSVYDLILQILLGFGTVMVAMEDVRRQLEVANRELMATRDRLEGMARLDPLTDALNRHAFYNLVDHSGDGVPAATPGCVVVVDIDGLKPINDSYGHAVGDAAIRAVAKAIRSVIRPDDMLFRWGGDEFLVVLFNVPEADVRTRIERLNTDLTDAMIPGQSPPPKISVSFGLSSFASIEQLEHSIDQADNQMYMQKHGGKVSADRGNN
ncbi:MAG TPA: GGDEF domain-containing protein [Blastocatellia bacterium]|nr:GGDEF domain-containing protein [Blastocatellia bacterium]